MSELTFFDGVALTAAEMGKATFTEPDDDWSPMMFIQGTQDGESVTPVVPLAPFMGDDREKDILAHILMPAIIKEFKASVVVLLFSVWTAKEKPGGFFDHGQGEYIPPSQRPDRIEAITLAEYTSEGITRWASAEIIRYEDKPPTLGEWENSPGDGYSGRFVEPIIAAMKAVAGK